MISCFDIYVYANENKQLCAGGIVKYTLYILLAVLFLSPRDL